MRVVEPGDTHKNTESAAKRKSSRSRKAIAVASIAIVVLGIFLFINNKGMDEAPSLQLVDEQDTITAEQANQEQVGEASGDEKYQSLWYSLPIPDTQTPMVAPDINEDTEFSRLVSATAESRGYKLQKIYFGDSLSSFRGVVVAEDVVEPLTNIVQEASLEGLELSISSGYRTLDEQEVIFYGRYSAQIASGLTEIEAINAVLEGAAPPGYSKHHSAYTVDMTCAGLGAQNFIGTACDEWLSADDFANAKKFGFIPSYPKNIDVQGPVPEPWEYNYVGTEILQEINLL